MSKYILRDSGYGKFKHKVPKEISESRAKNFKKEGKKVYDSIDEARRDC